MKLFVLSVVAAFVLFSFSSCGAEKEAPKKAAKSEDKGASKVVKKKAKKSSKGKLGNTLIKLPRSYKKGDIIEVRTVVTHPQDTGLGKKAKPAYYVSSIEVKYDGATVASFDTKPAISKDPYFSFKIKAVKTAPLKVLWKDNKGGVFEKSVNVNVGG